MAWVFVFGILEDLRVVHGGVSDSSSVSFANLGIMMRLAMMNDL